MSGSEDEGRARNAEQVIGFKRLKIQQKRFYLDVKQNPRGRFIKIAEIAPAGRKNRLVLSLGIANQFKDYLTQFNDLYVNLGPQNPESAPEEGKIKSVVITMDSRRYYLDLKENDRGRFLRVTQTLVRNSRIRSQIGIPAQGMIEFRDALTDLLDEYGANEEVEVPEEKPAASAMKKELPEGTDIRVENKKFYFDVRQNDNGVYMRVSEVKGNYRASITIPDVAWARFRDVFADYVEKCGLPEPKSVDGNDNESSN